MNNNPNSTFALYNERGEKEFFHKDHMLWKVPSDHQLNGKQYDAELQVFFT